MQIKKSYVNNNGMEDQELLTLDAISPTWAKRLEESKLLSLLSLERLQLYLELKDTLKCVVGEAYGFSSPYESSCKRCSKIGWKFLFYFIVKINVQCVEKRLLLVMSLTRRMRKGNSSKKMILYHQLLYKYK